MRITPILIAPINALTYIASAECVHFVQSFLDDDVLEPDYFEAKSYLQR